MRLARWRLRRPVLLAPNPSVTIAISREARTAIGLVKPTNRFPLRTYASARRRLRRHPRRGLHAALHGVRVAPEIGGVFYATYLAIARDACVPLDVTPDGGPTIRQIGSLGTGRCSGTHALRGLSR